MTGSAPRAQLSLAPDLDAACAVATPRGPSASGRLRVVPELGERGRELDQWRISGRTAPELTPFSATHCTGNAGLCGVCTGGPCQHDLEQHQHDQEHDQEPEPDEEPEP